MRDLVFVVLRAVIKVLLWLVADLEVHGRENFPDPPYIAAINHLSVYDSVVLLHVCPHNLYAFAAAKHKKNPLYGPLLRATKAIWVHRGEVDRKALQQGIAVLKNGGVLGVAPEGTRARGPYALQEGKPGVAYLAAHADVPIVPVGLSGTEQVKDNLPRLRRTHIRVNIGEPIYLPESGRLRGKKLREYTEEIMRRLAALLPEEYRGVYA